MDIIPAVDVLEGECVQLRGGSRGSISRYGDPLRWVSRFIREGARRLHVVDLGSAFDPAAGANRRVVMRLLSEMRFNWPGIRIQVGGGIRNDVSLRRALRWAHMVVVGTRGVLDPGWLERAARRFPGRVIPAVDARGGEVLTHGWTSSSGVSVSRFAGRLRRAGIRTLLYTDVGIEGRLTGIGRARAEEVMEVFTGIDVIWAGGVASLADITVLRDAGASGCVLGSCLYEGRLGLAAALRTGRWAAGHPPEEGAGTGR